MTRTELAKPILFNTDMTRAILENIKMTTRRCVKPKQLIGFRPEKCPNGMPEEFIKEKSMMFLPYSHMEDAELISASYKSPYKVGDVLYVRETWADDRQFTHEDTAAQYFYRADFPIEGWSECKEFKWRPSIHMPKEAARIFLKVTDVRVERLQDITALDVIKEGAERYIHVDGSIDEHGTRTAFIGIWNSTIKKTELTLYGWDANPWVWRIEFERIEPD